MQLRSRSILVLALATVLGPGSIAGATAVREPDFAYTGSAGPAHWSELDPQWAACGAGSKQSPVNFAHPGSDSSAAELTLHRRATRGDILNDGHTVEVLTAGRNTLRIGGTIYRLAQFHFHVLSEHRLRGRGYDAELHLVHKSAKGGIAVLAVLLQRGKSSGALAPVLRNLPDDVEVPHRLAQRIRPYRFLPADTTHLDYVGSLTTPPCTEGVHWVVLTHPVPVADVDLAALTERIGTTNARPVQRTLR